ncbi:hypothetical protein B0E50_05090 [Rhodanobacter sp. C01]|nr:hypothetical protein B0E50_05090 [Rhodanobacter sp. C01]
MKTRTLMAAFLGAALLAQALPIRGQNLIPQNTADLYPFGPTARGALGQPHAFGRLFVQLEVMPTCTFNIGGVTQPVLIRCTRGVPYRARILNDADTAFDLTRVLAPRLQDRDGGLVRINAQRLDVEF